jgi:TetR/AcrR family transcriptional repressor of nem operon
MNVFFDSCPEYPTATGSLAKAFGWCTNRGLAGPACAISSTPLASRRGRLPIEILNLYFANNKELLAKTVLDETQPPLRRLRKYIAAIKAVVEQNDMRTGCMLGNFSAEVTHCDGMIRTRLAEIFTELRVAVMVCLKAAVKAKELPAGFKVTETAGFIISALQGAILLSKAHRNVAPIEQFEQILFSKVLA